MLKFDLHYHANIFRLSPDKIRTRMEQHKQSIQKSEIDFIASTEHAYKDPLTAYLYLKEAVNDLETAVIPGIEALTKEGIDIIFLYTDEESLRLAGLMIVPHPRTPGHTGAANKLSEKDYQTLLSQADYVEIHNGASVLLRQLFQKKYLRPLVPSVLRKKVEDTFELPEKYRGVNLGWAVSSDAHYPKDQVYVGGTHFDITAPETYFEFLKRRIRFEPHQVSSSPSMIPTLLKNGLCVFLEALLKKHYKLFLQSSKL
ncbi:MAG: hypothetical protein B6247_19350 [Candidatus Parabeggiatoa sp. nov. 2]|nr:MAG: hypothetical protein B6247_19350 [Beggiatoa sp. 4572_84]